MVELEARLHIDAEIFSSTATNACWDTVSCFEIYSINEKGLISFESSFDINYSTAMDCKAGQFQRVYAGSHKFRSIHLTLLEKCGIL